MNDLADTRIVLCRYRYDALDRLAGVDSGTAKPVWRFYQKSRLSVEIQGALRRSVFQMDDQLLAEHRLSGSADQSELLGTDRQRSVLHAQGSQGAQSTTYSPYGHCPPATALPGFNGERRDPVTGHYLLGNGYRAYNPVLMRFNQPDNLSPFGRGGLSAYAYCQGDPVNRRDPSGHAPVLTFFNFLNDPLEPILDAFIKNTPGKDLAALSATSSTMKAHVERLAIIPSININDPQALVGISQALKGEVAGVLPSALKRSESFIKTYESASKLRFYSIHRDYYKLAGYGEYVHGRVDALGVRGSDVWRRMARAQRLNVNPVNQVALDSIERDLIAYHLARKELNRVCNPVYSLDLEIRYNLGVLKRRQRYFKIFGWKIRL